MCLDIDDTLIDFTAAGRRSLESLLGRADGWPTWERITDDFVARVVSGELDYADMHTTRTQAFLGELGIDVDLEQAADFELRRQALQRRRWRLFDDVLPCLKWLTAAGVTLAAVTNASGGHQRGKLDQLGLSGFFQHIAIAGEMGVAKPDPVMFHKVCSAAGCDPAHAVHVGDRLSTDAVGARDAGLGGIWLDRHGDGGDVPPEVYVLQTLTDLPELLVSEFARLGVPVQR